MIVFRAWKVFAIKLKIFFGNNKVNRNSYLNNISNSSIDSSKISSLESSSLSVTKNVKPVIEKFEMKKRGNIIVKYNLVEKNKKDIFQKNNDEIENKPNLPHATINN